MLKRLEVILTIFTVALVLLLKKIITILITKAMDVLIGFSKMHVLQLQAKVLLPYQVPCTGQYTQNCVALYGRLSARDRQRLGPHVKLTHMTTVGPCQGWRELVAPVNLGQGG